MRKILWLIVCFALVALPGRAEEYSNEQALSGVKGAKAYFDVNVGQPGKLLARLQTIYQTYNQLEEAGVTPDFVIGFRSTASKFVTRGEAYVQKNELADKQKVRSWVEQFQELGVSMEQCRIADSALRIDPKDILPAIKVVANGYISMIGYQVKGYALVPMD